jgi:hypothetical protein
VLVVVERYKPPEARVEDSELALSTPTDRPRVVTISLIVIAAVAAYLMLNDAARPLRLAAADPERFLVIGYYVIVHGTNAVLLVFAFRGHNWARIGLVAVALWYAFVVVVSSYGIMSVAMARGRDLMTLWPLFVTTLGLMLVRLVATGMLFTSTSKAWFKRPRDRKREATAL